MEPKQLNDQRSEFSDILSSTYFKVVVIVAFLVAVAVFIFNRSPDPVIPENATNIQQQFPSITLSNGEQVLLKNDKLGVALKENEITYYDGTAVNSSYQRNQFLHRANFLPNSNDYIVISSPGNQIYQVQLPDSTKIWLNSNSSVTIPSNYSRESGNRTIQLKGEAYFDVTKSSLKDKKKSFAVVSNGQLVEVYSTKFNLSAYPEQPTKTTLLDGNLKITPLPSENLFLLPDIGKATIELLKSDSFHLKFGAPVFLSPKKQARLEDGKFFFEDVEVDEVVVWKNDQINYRYMTLERILNIISKWYGVGIIFRNPNAKAIQLGGGLDRHEKLSNLLMMLSTASNTRIFQEGNNVIVSK